MGAELPLVARARTHTTAIAVDGPDGAFTFAQLLDASARLAALLLGDAADLDGARIAYLVEPGARHVAVQWALWRAGAIAVPLALSHPPMELAHVIADAGVSVLIVDAVHRPKIDAIAAREGIPILETPGLPALLAGDPHRPLPDISPTRPALMVYTSGTTGRPKGAVHTHDNLRAHVESLVEAWQWRADDRTLLVLPLHHVHGIINVQLCALWAGARCDVLPGFEAEAVLDRFASGDLSVFMAVPTIYARLVAAWEAAPPDRRAAVSAGCRRMRLMVSGSAALPVPTLHRWQDISGHVLLERYGMTEIGMALSNPLHGERRPGFVGTPLPGVQARLVDDAGQPAPPGSPGEIEVRGPGVFLEYWNRPAETAAAFRDGWFRTGDTAVIEHGSWRILGRISVDILKTGGFKVSALEIEDVLRGHPAIADCAVVGLADDEWGERVAAAIVVRAGNTLEPGQFDAWARERLAPYKIPRVLCTVPDLPRNAMGKVTKPAVRTLFEEQP